jgi:hypothetical protein
MNNPRVRAAAMLEHPETSLPFPIQAIRLDRDLLFAPGGDVAGRVRTHATGGSIR